MSWEEFWIPRRLFGLFALLALTSLAVVSLTGVFVFDLRISEDQLNRTVAAKLPFERRTGPVVWRVEAAKLTVLAASRLAVTAEVKAATPAHEGQAKVAGSGILAFRDGAFWLSDIDLDTLEIQGVRALDAPDRRPSTLGKALGGLVNRSETLKRALDRAGDAALSLGVREAEPALNAVFKAVPVYRLRDDWKGTAARAALISLRTDGHDLVATLDPVGAVVRVVAVTAIVLLLLYNILCLIAAFTSWLGGLADWLLFWW